MILFGGLAGGRAVAGGNRLRHVHVPLQRRGRAGGPASGRARCGRSASRPPGPPCWRTSRCRSRSAAGNGTGCPAPGTAARRRPRRRPAWHGRFPPARCGARPGRCRRPVRPPPVRPRCAARRGSAAGRRGPRRPGASGSPSGSKGFQRLAGSTRMPTRLMVSTRPRDCRTRTASRTTERETFSSSSRCSASMTWPAGRSPATMRVPRCSMARWWRLVDIVVSIVAAAAIRARPTGAVAAENHRLFVTRRIPPRGRCFPAARGNTYGLLTATDPKKRVPQSRAGRTALDAQNELEF